MRLTKTTEEEAHACNKGFAIAGVLCSADTFVQDGSSVLRMSFVLKLPAIANPQNVSGNFKTKGQQRMKVKSIFVNLPIKDIKKTRDFWTKLGFSFNEQFSDDRALCLVLNDGLIYSMLITHEMFSTFTNRPITDSSTTQVLTAIQVDSREEVDRIVKLALENGGTRYRESADHGWMYYDTFADLDGHQWEVMFTDETQTPQ